MANYQLENFLGYSDVFRSYWTRTVELMRILGEVIENEGMEVPPFKQLYTMVSDTNYIINSEYEEVNKIVKEDNDPIIYVGSSTIKETIKETIQSELQSLKDQ
jgi:hypothetical protein